MNKEKFFEKKKKKEFKMFTFEMSYSHITSDPNAEGSMFISLGSKSEEKMAKNTKQQRQL